MRDSKIRVLFGLVIIPVFLFLAQDTQGGTVRSIITDDKTMNRVSLRMGRSTVLRFLGDRPRKVVIGNQNYYNVEFVQGTTDVTLQPLQTVPTNLFVYCQKQIYGFLLKTNQSGSYDDLVNVHWRAPKTVLKVRAKAVVLDKKTVRNLRRTLWFGRKFKAYRFEVTSSRNSRIVLVDFKLKKTSSKKINLQEVKVFATRRGRKLGKQSFAVDGRDFNKNGYANVRLAITLKKKRGFTLKLKFGRIRRKIIIGSRLLRQ